MHRFVQAIFVTVSLATITSAQKRTTQPTPGKSQTAVALIDGQSAGRLPVKRVVLYKNGVGYFEHSARVHGNQDLAIDFTTAQLTDVLKSLTVVDLGEGRVSGVRYNSIAPLDQRLKTLRLPFGEQVTRADFLAALRGARVEVRNGSATSTGRLLSVEKERRANGKGDFYDVTEFSIMTDTGDMRNFELGPATSVRLAERDLSDEVGKYLSLVGSSRARDLRRMTAMMSSALSKQGVEAESKGVGEMFEYRIKQKITIGKNQSALVPILQSNIDAEKVTLWSLRGHNGDDDDDEKPGRPLRALWITNSTGLTLDSGSFNILEGDTFAGEGLIDTLRPDERRLLSYAADTAVHIKAERESSEKPVSRVRIAKGIMVLTTEQREVLKYTIRNSDTSPRQVVIEHPVREGWKLAEGPKSEETSASSYRFRAGVAPGQTPNYQSRNTIPKNLATNSPT